MCVTKMGSRIRAGDGTETLNCTGREGKAIVGFLGMFFPKNNPEDDVGIFVCEGKKEAFYGRCNCTNNLTFYLRFKVFWSKSDLHYCRFSIASLY